MVILSCPPPSRPDGPARKAERPADGDPYPRASGSLGCRSGPLLDGNADITPHRQLEPLLNRFLDVPQKLLVAESKFLSRFT